MCVTGAPMTGLSVPAQRSAVVMTIIGVSVVGPAIDPEMIVFCLSWAPAQCCVVSPVPWQL